jgi:hypothetical protein
MSSGPEPTPPGQDWAAVEHLQQRLYPGPAPEDRPHPNGEPKIDTSVPHPARRYDYWLGGKDNFAADRASGDQLAALYPSVRTAAVENRRFLQRAVAFLAGECGIRQFLDIGTGLPTADNTHEVAQRIAADSMVVYVDNDPLVMAHARALLTGDPAGRTAYIERDLRNPQAILDEARTLLDFDRPIGLMLVAVAHFLPDADEPVKVIGELLDAMPAGSYLVLSHASADPVDEATRMAWDRAVAEGRHGAFQHRGYRDVIGLIGDWDPVAPGLVPVADWRRTGPEPPPPFADAAAYGLVALKRPQLQAGPR